MNDKTLNADAVLATLSDEEMAKVTPPTVEQFEQAFAEGEKARAAALGAQEAQEPIARSLRFR